MGTGFYDQCTQGKFTIIKDCVKIADNTTIPPNTVVPTLACFGGSPGQNHASSTTLRHFADISLGHFIEDLPESTQEIVEARTKQYYTRFQALDR